MLRSKKHDIVDELGGAFADAGVVVVTHYMGMSVAELTDLRHEMRQNGARFRVTKNTLAKIALKDGPHAQLTELFSGPTAIAFSKDPVAAPKAVQAFAKKNDKLIVLGGSLEGSLLSADQVKALADLPSLDELRAKLIGMINTPATRLAALMQAPGGQLARVLNAYAEKG